MRSRCARKPFYPALREEGQYEDSVYPERLFAVFQTCRKYSSGNQIKSLNRGSSAFTETWDYDGTGNWLTYDRNGTVENRTHNLANEIQTSCTHDHNGNMTVMPGMKGKYDGWNRLVEILDTSDSPLATYSYNGLNQRVRKTVSGIVTESYFNANWQELESREPGTVSPQWTSYIWGQRYIDDLVLRECGQEKLYSLADPNWNVVAVTDDAGTVQERMKYDAFGKITWMSVSFVAKANSDLAWNRTFTGQVLDAETGLMLYRNRFYHTGLGWFVQRDPIGYEAGDVSVYRYVANNPVNGFDTFGLACCDGKEYDPNTQCCVNDAVVDRESVWKCIRPVNMNPLTRTLGRWHSYICCGGSNLGNCFSLGTKEDLMVGDCTEYKVCPADKKKCCDSPTKPSKYTWYWDNCNKWTNNCVADGVKQ